MLTVRSLNVLLIPFLLHVTDFNPKISHIHPYGVVVLTDIISLTFEPPDSDLYHIQLL
jgi:hypothetical protein